MSDFDIPSNKPQPKPSVEKTNPSFVDTETKTDTPEKPKYSQEELLKIFDEIIFSGEYSETIYLRGRVEVKFRTRTAEEIGEIQSAIDNSRLNLLSSVEQQRSLLTLEKALMSYNGKDLSIMKSEEKSRFIQKISGPIVGMLMNALQEFDNKIFEACKEGEENF